MWSSSSSSPPSPSLKRSSALTLRLTVAALAALTLATATALPAHAASVARASTSFEALETRHGDHGHEEEEEEGPQGAKAAAHDIGMIHADHDEHKPASHVEEHMAAATEAMDGTASKPAVESQKHTHSHGHGHAHADIVVAPVASDADLALRPVPVFPSHRGGGHSHGHGGGPSLQELNETSVYRWRGPDPLSYIEWDWGYQLGNASNLRRFASQDALGSKDELMGSVDDRWRRLLDERDPEDRERIMREIHDQVEMDGKPIEPGRHRWLMMLHVLGASLSCFVLLPIALALRAASSSLSPVASVVYLAWLFGSLLLAGLYRALTPRLYAPNSHSGMGWAVFFISGICLAGDVLDFARQILQALTVAGSSTSERFAAVLSTLGGARRPQLDEKYDALEEERMLSAERPKEHPEGRSGSSSPHRVHFSDEETDEARWAGSQGSQDTAMSPTSTMCETPRTSFVGGSHSRQNSLSSILHKLSGRKSGHSRRDSTLSQTLASAEEKPAAKMTRAELLRSILRYTHVTVARSMVVMAFVVSYSGLAVYTGSCRSGTYQNACLAHGIKGGIFAWFGILTFARYLGAYSDIGWAWNCRPRGDRGPVSAEWVENFVIFFYGATNMWMERFGAKPGDPYSVRQVQHISIAVMFCFAGLVGLILETRSLRRLLALPAALSHAGARAPRTSRTGQDQADAVVDAQTPPPSYSGSFNPFPALVIAVTGLAMSAHHQDYVYEVEIHMLWGNLLAAFSMLRCLTYFLLWLRPPASVLPSRPPTEALASFALTCGGLVFMLSSEEVSYAAMRHGFGDMMAIMNMAVAFISLTFCIVAGVMITKAWALKREMRNKGSMPMRESRSGSGWRHSVDQEPSSSVFVLEDEEEAAEAVTTTTAAAGEAQQRHLAQSPEPLHA